MNKGFAISGMIYSILILFLLILFGLLSVMGARKMILDKLKNDVITELNYDITQIEPSVPESVSFAEDSWETIAAIVKSGKADQYYNVGDTKEVALDGYTNGSESTFTVRIANMSTPEECLTEGFSQTACGFVVEFVDIITEQVMNSTQTSVGGWPASELYDFVNEDLYSTLPIELKNVIINTYVVSGYSSEDYFVSNDKFYLLSPREIYNSQNDLDANKSRQLDYYKNNNVTTSNNSGEIKLYQGVETSWWLRSASTYGTFYYVNGGPDSDASYSEYGVAPAFRI